MTQDPIASIAALLEEKGSRRYGLAAVSQLQHALQAALQAEQTGGDAALVTAALLHDIGHMVHGLGEDPAADGVDDRHEELGRAYLAALFGPAVTEPVRLHVAAKLYLCATEPDYYGKLSPDSVRSLALQAARCRPRKSWCSAPCRSRRPRCGCAASTRGRRSRACRRRRWRTSCRICASPCADRKLFPRLAGKMFIIPAGQTIDSPAAPRCVTLSGAWHYSACTGPAT
jgi:predicted HD phosphohydrolase